MEKKLCMLLISLCLVSMSACGNKEASVNSDNTLFGGEQSIIDVSGTVPNVFYDRNNPESILNAIDLEFKSAAQSITDDSTNVFESIGDSYDTYGENKAAVTDFYNNSLKDAKTLYSTIETISVDYFKCIAEQGLAEYKVWDNSMEDFYDVLDDGMEDFYKVWDRIYENLYDKCDDLIEDASDTFEYEEYSYVWSEMYHEYSDAWTAMYSAYSDAWDNTYQNYSSVWSGFYEDNDDVDSILKEAAQKDNKKDLGEGETDTIDSENIDNKDIKNDFPDANEELVDGMRPEFKEAMDSYEAFYDEYCDFMKTYSENLSDMNLLARYTDMLTKAAEMSEKFEAWKDNEMNDTEMNYYLDVNNRVTKKLLEISVSK